MTDVLGRLTGALAGRYRIERELGAGGMATVYLAHDVRHDRNVALKVLRPELSAILGGERFLAEIKTTANLQHPHILSLFDSGEADGLIFYVMPYVEGESLRDRLRREKQLPVDEAVRIATEAASALDYAHRHGVVHRDIKPENVLLQEGQALVADFGIALAASRSEGGSRLTETGMSLGTPHYMAPEQAMGEREITPKADVYALGCVLYEMLAGEPPFTGPTPQAIIARVMTEEPRSLTLQRKTVPPHVEAAVLRALEKLPADRFDSAEAFRQALADGSFVAEAQTRAARPTPGAGPSRRPPYATLAVGAVLLAAALIGWLRPRPAPATSRQRVALWQSSLGQLIDPGVADEATQAAIAPDGSSIVFADSVGGRLRLMRKRRSEGVATPLPGTDGALSPFFSPDGRWIGFSTVDGSVKKVSVDGGGAVTLARRGDPTYSAAAWLDDGTIVYSEKVGLSRVSADGGPSRPLIPDTSRSRANVLTIWPLPGSRGVLYTQCPDNCALASSVHVFDLRSGADRMLIPDAAGAWYAPTGHLLYTDRSGGLYAVRFDLGRLAVTSGPVPVIEDVVAGSFTMAASGTVLYSITGGGGAAAELMWVARDGSAVPLDSTWRGDFQYPALSPDGKTLAVSVHETTTQLWVRRPDGTRQQLTNEGTANWRPSWTSDGRSIVFSSNQRGGSSADAFDLYEMPVGAGAPARLLLHHRYGVWEGEISSDGRWLVMRSDEQGNIGHIRGRRLDGGDTALVPLVVDTTLSMQVALSRDGRWLAYSGYATGRSEVYVRPFPGVSTVIQVSHDGGTEPRWAHSGRELFYRSGQRLMAVAVTPGPTLAFGATRALFPAGQYRTARNRQEYDVAPDDRHFVMIRAQPGAPSTVEYVENWFSELKARVKR